MSGCGGLFMVLSLRVIFPQCLTISEIIQSFILGKTQRKYRLAKNILLQKGLDHLNFKCIQKKILLKYLLF